MFAGPLRLLFTEEVIYSVSECSLSSVFLCSRVATLPVYGAIRAANIYSGGAKAVEASWR